MLVDAPYYIHSAILAVDADIDIGSIWSCRAELYVDIKKLSQNHDEMFSTKTKP